MNKCELFIDAFLDFDDVLRSNEAFDETKFNNVCFLLKDLKEIIQEQQSVPLSLASIFIDLYSSIESSAYRHEGKMKQVILHAADTLTAIAREVISES